MRDDRFFRVIVLGGLSLVGPACGRDASNGSAPDREGSAVDSGMSSGDAGDDADESIAIGREGGSSDRMALHPDASSDADLPSDATSDAADGSECGVESFPGETALPTCSVRCVPAGCPCVIPAMCWCTNCTDASAASDQ